MANIFRPPCDEGAIRARPVEASRVQQASRWVLPATILGSSMAFIDGTVVNVAVPIIQDELHASVAAAQWVIQAYGLTLASLILVGGSLGDRFGRRRMFVTGIVIFTLASVVCGLSQSLGQLIGARVVQGVGAALLTPGSLAIISASFNDNERGRAIGTWSGFTSLTSAAGPVLGGLLIAAGSWRDAFFLNVPVAVLALLFATRVPESRDSEALKNPIDWRGAVLATSALGGIVYGFVTASTDGFGRPDVIIAIAGSLFLLALLIWVERRQKAPMIPLQLFRSRTFSGANLFTFLLYAALGSALFFLPFNLLQVQGYSPQAAGAALLPFVLLMFALSRWSGGLVDQYGARLPLIIGPLIAAAGFGLFARPDVGGSYWTTFFPAALVLGLGMAVSVAPLTTTVMGSVETSHSGLASGINNAVARTAGVLALAIVSLFVVWQFGNALEDRMTALDLSPQVHRAMTDQRSRLGAAEVPSDVDAATAARLERAISDSFVSAFRLAMAIAAGLSLGASLCAAVTIDETARPVASDSVPGG